MLTQARLKELLHYDPETGIFTRLVRCGPRKAGTVAGTPNNHGGHLRIGIDGPYYLSHRLAWLYMTGSWPQDETDHINGVPTDNRWNNLREATKSLNLQNQRRAHRTNPTGLIGAHRHGVKFQSSIGVSGRCIPLGTFDTAEEAHAAYLSAKRVLHEGNTL